MAWTALTFAYGSVLTSTKMTQLYDNFAYGTGSPAPNFTAGLTGTTGTFSGAVSGTTGTFSGAVSGTTGTFSGVVQGSGSVSHGVKGIGTGTGVTGVWGTATGVGSVGLRGESGSSDGVRGAGASGSYDFYADGFGTNYGPFTGGHDGLVHFDFDARPGDIVCDHEIIARKNISNTITRVDYSSSIKCKTAIGVLVACTEITVEDVPAALVITQKIRATKKGQKDTPAEFCFPLDEMRRKWKRVTFNALGEGMLNVCREGGNIEAGDYLHTSSVSGKGMRQADDLLHSYTVARAREAVKWEEGDESIKLIACVYLCG
jgi:hypothetical protein